MHAAAATGPCGRCKCNNADAQGTTGSTTGSNILRRQTDWYTHPTGEPAGDPTGDRNALPIELCARLP